MEEQRYSEATCKIHSNDYVAERPFPSRSAILPFSTSILATQPCNATGHVHLAKAPIESASSLSVVL